MKTIIQEEKAMKASASLEQLKKYFNAHKEKLINDYFTFLKFESVSSEPSYKPQVKACLDWLVDYVKNIGFKVEVWPTSGHPTLYAYNTDAGPSQPTLLIYNHYDVQPVDPLELWDSPPFDPTVREGQVYARGAQDNKGQCFYVLLALKALMEQNGKLPVNVKLCIEGEEEVGSIGLGQIIQQKKNQLKADYLAIVDLGMMPEHPAITLGTRGIVTMDVEVTGTRSDLHSGSHGGLAFNPIHALVQLLASVRDPSGKIVIPGFYDDVVPLNDKERSQLSLNFDPANYEKQHGAKPAGGEKTIPHLERTWSRPTLEVNGISGGYSGDGFKTVIPSKAIAKVSCRLVPKQDPAAIGRLVAKYLESHAPEGVRVKVDIHSGTGKAVRGSVDSSVVKAFAKAYEEVFNTSCDFLFAGGSIPVAPALADACGGEVVMVGLGLDSDKIHAPNEHFGLDRIEKGFLSTARAIELLKQ